MNGTDYTIHPDFTDSRFAGLILARVDSRITASGYVHSYAPISMIDGVVRPDPDQVFEDFWGEVISMDDLYDIRWSE